MKKNRRIPKVNIIIANFNGEKNIVHCLNSLKELKYPKNKVEIIVVDNGSKDNSINIIKKFSGVKIIKNDENSYCRANNLGIKKATGELIALLNNDTMVDENWLTELVNVILSDKKIGAVGSKIIFPDGRIQSVGHREHPGFYFRDEGFKEKDEGQYEKEKEIESICGCSVLYKKKCLKEVGMLDEDFVMYCEDVDMSIRCKKKGWKLYYASKSIVMHKYLGTSNQELLEKYVERNRLLLLAKYHPEKLPYLMFNSEYYKNNDEIFEVIPQVINKLIKTHGIKKFENISTELAKSMKQYFYLRKDSTIKGLIVDLEKEKERLEQETNLLKTRLKEIYESKGYRFILSNVWKAYNLIKIKKKYKK